MTQDVTTPVQIEAGRAERDGCACPPWIERCIHFEDARLFLTDRSHPDLDEIVRSFPRYLVGCARPTRINYSYDGVDHEAALTALHAMEEELLRGEPS